MATYYRKCWCENGTPLPQDHKICKQNVLGAQTCAKCYPGYTPTPEYGAASGRWPSATIKPNGKTFVAGPIVRHCRGRRRYRRCRSFRRNKHLHISTFGGHAAIGTACDNVFRNETIPNTDPKTGKKQRLSKMEACGTNYENLLHFPLVHPLPPPPPVPAA